MRCTYCVRPSAVPPAEADAARSKTASRVAIGKIPPGRRNCDDPANGRDRPRRRRPGPGVAQVGDPAYARSPSTGSGLRPGVGPGQAGPRPEDAAQHLCPLGACPGPGPSGVSRFPAGRAAQTLDGPSAGWVADRALAWRAFAGISGRTRSPRLPTGPTLDGAAVAANNSSANWASTSVEVGPSGWSTPKNR